MVRPKNGMTALMLASTPFTLAKLLELGEDKYKEESLWLIMD
jgi:hypothetical protein